MLIKENSEVQKSDGIAGVVILYYPSESVMQNIQTYLSEVELLYVFDNSPGVNKKLMDNLCRLEKVTYLTEGKNVGIGAALNIAVRKALQQGYNYLLTMDQDSSAYQDMISTMFVHLKENERIGLITPFHQHVNAPKHPPQTEVETVVAAMTSGNILRLSAFDKVGGFIEKLFIDYVDIEYCLRLQMAGFSIVRVNKAILLHTVGHTVSRRFFGRTVYPVNHLPVRHYYQTRNRFYLHRLYGKKFPEYFRPDRKMFWNGILKILLYENQRFKKLMMISKGFMAYLRNDFSSIPIA
jgi:rhamnosyltransferase